MKNFGDKIKKHNKPLNAKKEVTSSVKGAPALWLVCFGFAFSRFFSLFHLFVFKSP